MISSENGLEYLGELSKISKCDCTFLYHERNIETHILIWNAVHPNYTGCLDESRVLTIMKCHRCIKQFCEM